MQNSQGLPEPLSFYPGPDLWTTASLAAAADIGAPHPPEKAGIWRVTRATSKGKGRAKGLRALKF